METKLTPDQVTARVRAAINDTLGKLRSEGISAAMCISYIAIFEGRDDVPSSQAQIAMSMDERLMVPDIMKVLWWEMQQQVRGLGNDIMAAAKKVEAAQGVDTSCLH